MAKTYRSQSRDHRSLVAVSMASKRRTPLVVAGSYCEFSATCTNDGATVPVSGLPALLWPVVCASHRNEWFATAEGLTPQAIGWAVASVR